MSNKDVVLSAQAELTTDQIDTVEEIKEHLIKSQSVIDLVTNSIEAKNKDNALDLGSELNSMIIAYDEVTHAIGDINSILDALKEDQQADQKNA